MLPCFSEWGSNSTRWACQKCRIAKPREHLLHECNPSVPLVGLPVCVCGCVGVCVCGACVYVWVCMCVVQVGMCICVCVCMCMCVYVCGCVHVCDASGYVHMCMCVHVCICVYGYVHVCVPDESISTSAAQLQSLMYDCTYTHMQWFKLGGYA